MVPSEKPLAGHIRSMANDKPRSAPRLWKPRSPALRKLPLQQGPVKTPTNPTIRISTPDLGNKMRESDTRNRPLTRSDRNEMAKQD